MSLLKNIVSLTARLSSGPAFRTNQAACWTFASSASSSSSLLRFGNSPFLLKRYASSSSDFGEQKSPAQLTKIYYGTLTPKIKAVKVFSLSTSLAGLAAQPILMEQGAKIGGTGMVVFMCGFVGLFTFVTPLLLHFITKKYVTEIMYNAATQEYTATTISLILLKKEVLIA